jgi:type II secretion system protein I
MNSVRTTRRLRDPRGPFGPSGVLTGARTDLRDGFTLLEVLLSTVILAGALSALSQLSTNGVTAALRTENETLAAVRCQTKLDEILATNQHISSGQSIEFADDPNWSWNVSVSDGPTDSLTLLTVTVQRSGPRNSQASFSLSRLVTRSSLVARDKFPAQGDAS